MAWLHSVVTTAIRMLAMPNRLPGQLLTGEDKPRIVLMSKRRHTR